MEIIAVDPSKKKEISLFVHLPFKLYKKNKSWTPPYLNNLQLALDRGRHPFYAHSEATFFIARTNKEVVGRIAVLHNQHYCDFHHTTAAFFCCFESIEDASVSGALFSAAEDWAKSRRLNKVIFGRGLLQSDGQGILVSGFDRSLASGIPYNYPYYESLLQKSGFAKLNDFLSGTLDNSANPKLLQIAERVHAKGNFEVNNLTTEAEYLEWIPRLEVVRQGLSSPDTGNYPPTPLEFEFYARNLFVRSKPDCFKVILHGKDLAGYILATPNVNRALQQTHGASGIISRIDLRLEKKLTKKLDILGLGLLPEYQGLGGNALLYSELMNMLSAAGNPRAEIVQVDERNQNVLQDMKTFGVTWNKIHRIYIKNL